MITELIATIGLPMFIFLLIVMVCGGYVILRIFVFGIVKSFFQARKSYYDQLKKEFYLTKENEK
jgi:hypothetical protein